MLKRIVYCLVVFVATQTFCCEAKERSKAPQPPKIEVNEKQNLKKESMLADLDRIKEVFKVRYAPADWKLAKFGWNLNAEIEKCKVRVRNRGNPSIKEFQQIVRGFFNGCHDHHVAVRFYSTEWATLPFDIQSAEGRYFVLNVDEPVFTEEPFPLENGDEILEFGGKPIAQAMAEVQQERFQNMNDPSFARRAENLFTTRLGAFADVVPKGDVAITVVHRGEDKPLTYTLKWDYVPERVRGNNALSRLEAQVPENLSEAPLFWKHGLSPFFEQSMEESPDTDETETEDKTEKEDKKSRAYLMKQGKLPELGEPTFLANSDFPFRAYIYQNDEGKKIGYVRIPAFFSLKGGVSRYTSEELQTNVELFAGLMERYNDETDALVLDTLENPGGLDMYCYGLLSCLANIPLKLPTVSETLTQHDVYNAVGFLDTLSTIVTEEELFDEFGGDNIVGYPLSMKFLEGFCEYLEHVIHQWNEGKGVTDPFYQKGIRFVQPHPKGHYTKPVLVLVNEVCVSCGDIFPAVLQDNHRATIFGARTSGGGGCIESESFSNRNGISSLHYTGSIMYRLNGKPIENLGVTPDILCPLTTRDIQEDYSDYTASVNEALKQLLKSKN